jgi:outer membrane protein
MKLNLTLILLLLATFARAAVAEPKIGLVDVRKLFEEFYKTKAADAKIKEEASELKKESDNYMDQYKKMTDDYKKLLDEANNQAVSTEERDKRKKAAENKLIEIKELEATIRQFEKTATTTIEEKKRQMRDKLVGEIRAAINSKVKAGGYSLVLDISAESMNQTPVVLYHNGENDLTAAIHEQLNANAPVTPKTDDAKPKKSK